MAIEPVFRDAENASLRLEIPLSPQAGDPFLFIASETNAALSIAALREGVDPDSSTVLVLTELTLSPMYLAAKESLLRDLRALAEKPDWEARLSFSLDTFAGRLFLAGTKLSEVSHG